MIHFLKGGFENLWSLHDEPALIPLIGLKFLLFARGISSTYRYLKSLFLQACDRLVFRLFSANSKSSRADLISALPRITVMSAWFFNNPPAASCEPFPWQLSKKFLMIFEYPNSSTDSAKYPKQFRLLYWHWQTSQNSCMTDTIIHRVQVFWYWLLDIIYKVLVVFFVQWYNVKMFAYYVYFFRCTRHTIHL